MIRSDSAHNCSALALSAAVVATLASPTLAATLYWDADGSATGNNISGTNLGGGTSGEDTEWKTSGGNRWWDGTSAANTAWPSSGTHNAVFTGSAGTVNLGSAISAGTLNFGTTGYVIDLRDYTNGTSGNSLTITGLSGSAATIRRTSVGNPADSPTLTLSMANDTVWAGNIGSGGDRMSITVNGGKSLTVNQVVRDGGFSQSTLNITGAGTKLVLSGSGSTFAGNFFGVASGATFDVGNNQFAFRNLNSDANTTITSSGTGRIRQTNSNGAGTWAGNLTGTLGVDITSTNATGTIINGSANSYSGGTAVSGGTLNVDSNSGLGTGYVAITGGNVNFRSVAPVIGSLSGTGSGTTVLGTTGVDTNLTINQTAAGTFSRPITQFDGQTGSVVKAGAQTLTLGGTNTYSGSTRIDDGVLALASAGSINASSEINLNATTPSLTSGALNVAAKASFIVPLTQTLKGSGSVIVANSSAFTVDGTLSVGSTHNTPGATQGVINLATGTNAAATLNNIANLDLISANVSDRFATSGLLTYGGTLNVENPNGIIFAANQVYNLFDAGSFAGSFPNLNLPTLSGGLEWDTTNLDVDGTIAVVPEPATLSGLAIGALGLLRRRRA